MATRQDWMGLGWSVQQLSNPMGNLGPTRPASKLALALLHFFRALRVVPGRTPGPGIRGIGMGAPGQDYTFSYTADASMVGTMVALKAALASQGAEFQPAQKALVEFEDRHLKAVRGAGDVGEPAELDDWTRMFNEGLYDVGAQPIAIGDTLPTNDPFAASGDAAELRPLTLMFCNLVRPTTPSASLDAEALSAVVSTYRRYFAEVIESHGGFVAEYMGDRVLVYFGYRQGGEHDAELAVEAALALVEAVSQLVTPAGMLLQVRIGIATGMVSSSTPVLPGGWRRFGDPLGSSQAGVVSATRSLAESLQGIAEPNEVVISAGTRRQLGDRFELRDLGAQHLPGIPTPALAWAVLRPGKVTSRLAASNVGDRTVVSQGPPIGMASPEIVSQAAELASAVDTVASAEEVDLGDLLESEEERRAYFEAFGADSAAVFIRSARTKAGLTQSQLAQRLGVNQSRIAELERGGAKQGVTTGLLARIAEACDRKLLLVLEERESG